MCEKEHEWLSSWLRFMMLSVVPVYNIVKVFIQLIIININDYFLGAGFECKQGSNQSFVFFYCKSSRLIAKRNENN